MATMIFVSLCIVAEGFLLSCLFYFGRELRQQSRRGSYKHSWIAPAKPNIVPLQFIGPHAVAVWSQASWDAFVYGVDDSSQSRNAKSTGAAKEHYGIAA